MHKCNLWFLFNDIFRHICITFNYLAADFWLCGNISMRLPYFDVIPTTCSMYIWVSKSTIKCLSLLYIFLAIHYCIVILFIVYVVVHWEFDKEINKRRTACMYTYVCMYVHVHAHAICVLKSICHLFVWYANISFLIIKTHLNEAHAHIQLRRYVRVCMSVRVSHIYCMTLHSLSFEFFCLQLWTVAHVWPTQIHKI